MTEIVVAYRDGILTAPNGEKFRLVRGKTLADARHPGVRMRPESWGPMVVELSVDDPEDGSDTDARIDELRASVEQAEEVATNYRKQLAAVADVLGTRGLMPADAGIREGWLAEAVAAAIDGSAAALPTAPAPAEVAVVAPPRGARAPRKAKPAAVAPASEMDDEDDPDDLA